MSGGQSLSVTCKTLRPDDLRESRMSSAASWPPWLRQGSLPEDKDRPTRRIVLERVTGAQRVTVQELAKQLGNVSQACKIMGYSRDSSRSSQSLRCSQLVSAMVALQLGQGIWRSGMPSGVCTAARRSAALRRVGLKLRMPSRARVQGGL